MKEPKPWWVWGDLTSSFILLSGMMMVVKLVSRNWDGARTAGLMIGGALAWLLVRTLWRRHRARYAKPVNTDSD